MKKIIALLLCLATLLLLVGCDDGYEPVESTEEEARTVMQLKIGNSTYSVKYELYRALFLSFKSTVDGGDASVWSGDNKEQYIEKIDELILERVTDIYSVIHAAKKIGIDPYSSDFDKKVEKYIKVSVEGGTYNGLVIEGFDGSYDKYLASLKEANLNYSVQDLLIRYSLAYGEVTKYYAGYVKDEITGEVTGAHLEFTDEDVEQFYSGDDCVRVIRAYLPLSTTKDLEKFRQDIVNAANYGDDAVRQCIGGKSQTLIYDVENGELIGKHSHDKLYYGEMTDAAFALERFGVSQIITVNSESEMGYIVLYKLSKDASHFEKCYKDVVNIYKQNEIGKILDGYAGEMRERVTKTEFLSSLDRASIAMK